MKIQEPLKFIKRIRFIIFTIKINYYFMVNDINVSLEILPHAMQTLIY